MKPPLLSLCSLILLLPCASSAVRAQDVDPSRTSVSVLWFQNEMNTPPEAFWRYAIERAVAREFGEIKAVRMVGGTKFAARQMHIKEGDAINAVQARKMGEIVEAQRVIYGSYRRQGAGWRLSAHILNIATGKSSPNLTAAAPDLFAACDGLGDQLFKEIGVVPTEKELARSRRRITNSSAALELFARALAAQAEARPLAEAQAVLTKAISADPQFAAAYVGLASTYASQGNLAEAEKNVHKAIELDPGNSGAHQTLGILLMLTERAEDGMKELQQAKLLDPEDPETEIRLGELALLQNKIEEGVTHFREATRLDPFDSSAHAGLGRALAVKGEQASAIPELKEAERLDPEDANTLQMAFLSYDALKDTSRAIEIGERFLALVHKSGLNKDLVAKFAERVTFLRGTLTPTFLDIPQPRSYTATELQEALRSRLTADEMKEVVNPIEAAAGMKTWAEEMTRDAHTDMDKAIALFTGLRRRLDGRKKGGTRTAKEVFALWNKPDESFDCQEYAKLYIALARSVGLKAFYVHLERDFENRVVYHDCAIVYAGSKAVLVDLAYGWFGPNHREHRVLDDVQAIAHQLYQSDGSNRTANRCRIAVKLHPNFAWGMLALAGALVSDDQWDEAARALQAADQLEAKRWDSAKLHGIIAFHEEQWDLAQGRFKEALAINPDDPISYYYLGNLYAQQGRLNPALDALRASLRLDPPESIAQDAGQAIARINEKLAALTPKNK